MEKPPIAKIVYKLAMAGEQAGFTVEQMIRLLNAGMTVETLLDIIQRRLTEAIPAARSSCRIDAAANLVGDTAIELHLEYLNHYVLFRHGERPSSGVWAVKPCTLAS